MNSTGPKKKAFTLEDLSSIMDLCGNNAVASFVWGDLQISFGPRKDLATPISLTPNSPQADADLEEETRVHDELKVRQDQIDQMLIEDPLEAERLIAENELIDEEKSGDDEHGQRDEETQKD